MGRSKDLISVVVPTIAGREHHLERCEQAYCETADNFELIIVRDQPTCGVAWNIGIAEANGDIIHLTADDLEPRPGWLEAAMEKVEQGFLPAPRILKPNGELESCGWDNTEQEDGSPTYFTRIPFAPRQWFDDIGPMLETHYANDRYFSHQARTLGYETVIAREYLFIHHWATEGRLDHRMKADGKVFQRVIRG